jgi:plasmid stabilization system protein ParE
MNKPIKWSSYADSDFAILLNYLEAHWNTKVCLDFIENLEYF